MLIKNESHKISNKIKEFLQEKYKIQFIKQLGIGTFGEVYNVLMKNKVTLAMKIFKPIINEKYEKRINDEIKFSINLKSNSVICGLKSEKNFIDKQIIYVLFMEKAKFVDLNLFLYNYLNYNFLEIKNKTNEFSWLYNFSEETIQFFSYQIIKTFEFLDLNLLIHFDIKPANFLLGDNFTIKLSDFSATKKLSVNQKYVTLQNGTYHFMGPEFYDENKEVLVSKAKKVDYFAFGCVLFYMISRKDLIEEIKDEKKNRIKPKKNDIENFINDGIEIIYKLNYSQELKKLICDLIDIDANKRPNIKDLINNYWVNKDYLLIEKIKKLNYNEKLKIFIELQKLSFISKGIKRRKKYYIA
jgi:serine/threonine protein kinase